MKELLIQKIKTGIIRAENAGNEIFIAAAQIVESDSSSAEQRENARAIQKAAKHFENLIEDIRIYSDSL